MNRMPSRPVAELAATRHFLDLHQIDAATLRAMIDDARRMKEKRADRPRGTPDDELSLTGRIVALIFEKQSTRTRISFDVGVRQLGGQTIVLNGYDLQLGHGETTADTAKVLSRYVDAIVLRTADHQKLIEFAENATIPVINGLTDKTHPCQTLTDVMTFEEKLGPIKGQRVAWVGSGTNVAASWIHAAGKLGFELNMACPPGEGPKPEVMAWAKANGARLKLVEEPVDAVKGAACVLTDTWISITEEDHIGHNAAQLRHNRLAAYRVTEGLMREAAPGAIFMHCLPAHRGEEVEGEVLDGPQSAAWDEAENRLHAQKSILLWCLKR
jgi:ornithine carbamoyltransferase